jgi:PilZ domain
MTSTSGAAKIDALADTGTWNLQRSDLRYSFISIIEVADSESGQRIVGATSNLSRYGCHIQTVSPFPPGTLVSLKINNKGIAFHSRGKVVYAISGVGMGIHFENVAISDRALLKEWLAQVSAEELENRLRNTPAPRITLSHREIVVLAAGAVVLVAIIIAALAWFGLLP